MTPNSPLTSRGDGIELAIKVTPRAGRVTIEGAVADAAGAVWLAVKVSAPPEGGRANAAVLGLLAKRLGVPATACSLVAGAGSRWKRVRIVGDTRALERQAATLAGPSGGG